MDYHRTRRLFHRPSSRMTVSWGLVVSSLVLLLALGAGPVWSSSVLYKNYIVRYDRGWDIMCEPYVVKEGDWVLKIFRQKGEIAHTDFRDFLGIFQRLNPHVQNLDMLRPGQAIDIPLQKLEHGTLPGQASGLVTIPVISLAKVDDIIVQHSEQYQIQKGDTVSQLIAQRYGRFGTPAYEEGVKLFKAANIEITDLNRIIAGQNVLLPDPAMRDQAWYGSLYDEQGNLKETVNTKSADRAQAMAEKAVSAALPVRPTQASTPTMLQGPLADAAAAVGGKLRDKGTHYVPRPQTNDFEIDLSRHPMLEMPDNAKILFTQSNTIMGTDRGTFQTYWPDAKVVSYSQDTSTEEIVAAIFNALDQEKTDSEKGEAGIQAGFEDQGIQVVVRAKWIKPEGDQRHLCITPIASPSEQTPQALRRYLDQHGIILRELLPGSQTAAPVGDDLQRHAIRNVLDLAPANQKEFVQSLARALGFSYAPNISITFPYAGIQIKAFSNLISAGDGRELLVDYGELYGDALDAIRKTGPQVVQIKAQESYGQVVRVILSGLGLTFVENPVFLGAQRPAEYNTAITITGFLFTRGQNRQILLTGASLNPAVTDLVSSDGTEIIVW